jgi:hypothetical protein
LTVKVETPVADSNLDKSTAPALIVNVAELAFRAAKCTSVPEATIPPALEVNPAWIVDEAVKVVSPAVLRSSRRIAPSAVDIVREFVMDFALIVT